MKELSPEAIILKELVKPEKIEETHISYAMITKDYVYKLKKQVDFGFLDYRLSKSRRAFCILEKELNSRFSENVYLEVLKIVKLGKEFKLVPHTNTMFAIDYVLKMRRIKDEDFLSYRLKKGEITVSTAKLIGKQIAELFKKIETPLAQAGEYGSYDTIKFNCIENFEQTEKYTNKFIDEKIYDFIKRKTIQFLEENKLLFDKRINEGFVKDGHGDLRVEHVYFDGDKIGLLDCIEFNRRFRFNDVVSEIAFLCMEIDKLGFLDISDAIAEGFFEVFNDEDSKKLFNFYKCYRAYVRAKVTCFLLDEKGENWENFDTLKKDLDKLISISLYYALNMNDIKNFAFFGIMGSGKTKNAKSFSSLFCAKHLNTDVVRKELAGIPPTTSVKEDFNKGLYNYEMSIKTYTKLKENVEKKNKLLRSCIVDGSFAKKEFFEIFGNLLNYKILFYAPKRILTERLRKRETEKSVSDGRLELLEKQMEKFETENFADIKIETTGKVEDNIKKIVEFLLLNET